MTTDGSPRIAVVDLYLLRGRLRAEIPMHGFGRLTDVFNNAPGEFIGATVRMAAVGRQHPAMPQISMERHELVVRLRDVRLVRPIEESALYSTPTERRERIQARVVMDLDDWQVTGDLHLVDRISWLDFMTASRNRFITVSNASVRFVGVAEPLECEFLLVNGARVSALFEAT